MKKRILLSADSTCDIGEQLQRQYEVRFYPYHIEYRGESYLDNVNIRPDDLYAGFYEDGSLPKTSAVNVVEYQEYFKSLLTEADEVIHFNLGSALSSSYEHALLAARDMPEIHVIDSCNLSTGMGQLVIRAGRMIKEGMQADDIVSSVEELKPCVQASFVLETLDFMAAGGRCPQVLSHVSDALNLKLEIVVDNSDGSMHVSRMYHGSMRKTLREYVRKQIKRHPVILQDDVFITHSGGIEDESIEIIRAELLEQLPKLERIHVTQASCTISSHCGPGTIGILYLTQE